MNRFPGKITAFALITGLALLVVAAQTPPPSTEIFLAEMHSRAGRLSLGQPVNITNREGYDNQPMFLPDGASLLYTSVRTGTLPDIYRYVLRDQSTTQMTRTPEGEYSPTPMPGGQFFSVIRVEADQTQRLWKFPFAGGEPSLVLENIKPVGYHAWLDERTVALFVLGRPATLQLADLRTGQADTLERDIGRSLHQRPGRQTLTFVHKLSAEEWIIKELDPQTRRSEPLTRTLPGSEDFVWTPDGVLLSASGSKLFQFDPKKDKAWREVADFARAGLKGITRLAVSPQGDRLALVAALEAKTATAK
jgi:hypothetical protein